MALNTYDPINILKEIDQNIWIVDGSIVKMKFLWLINAPFQTRMTVIRLKDNSLWIHSPILITENLKKQIDQIGEVKYLISPNKIHYSYINQWKSCYPDALSFEAPGVCERAKKHSVEIKFDETLSNEAPIFWKDEIDQLLFSGSSYMEEVFFFHKKTNSLIIVDMIENFELSKISGPLKLFLKILKFHHPHGCTPPDIQKTFIGNKTIARKCFKTVLDWKPKKIILAHGKCYLENAEQELKRAFKWLI